MVAPRKSYRSIVFLISAFLSAFIPYEIGSRLGCSMFFVLLAWVVCIVPFGGIICAIAITIVPLSLVLSTDTDDSIQLKLR